MIGSLNYWIISDTHFGHDYLKKVNSRPEDFEFRILKSLYSVKEDDIVIHLGDFCFGQDNYWHKQFHDRLKAKKRWLILGNHDKKTQAWYLKNGWDFVADSLAMTFRGKQLLFSHMPQPLGHHDYNIHGHLHEGNHHREFDSILSDKHVLIKLEGELQIKSLKSVLEKHEKENR